MAGNGNSEADIQFYPLEEMGHLMAPDMVSLFDSFLRDKLDVSNLDAALAKYEKGDTNIGCPLCKNGTLKLVEIEPVYSGGMARVPSTKHHVANNYEYRCSNEECSTLFLGRFQWMWID